MTRMILLVALASVTSGNHSARIRTTAVMTPVDRNLLRLSTYELEFVKDVPRAVIIDEAVEIAKRFGTEESHKFINGILERIASDLNRA